MSDKAAHLDESDFRRVVTLLEERCGLHFHEGNRDILDAGLARVAEAEQLSLPMLAEKLADPTEALFQRVIQAVTIGETYFFRHPEHFAALSEQVVPQLLRAGRKRLRAWSAGCATGEEAYSVTMSLYTHAPGTELQVLGTDINHAALKIAERGRYGHHSLRTPSLLLDAFLYPVSGGEFEVAEVIKRLTSFRPLNLGDPLFPHVIALEDAFDIIICRNVLVYFASSSVAPVLRRLRDCLSEGGYLCVSALDCTEPIVGLEPVVVDGVQLWRRVPTPNRSTVAALPSRPSPPNRGTQAAPLRPPTSERPSTKPGDGIAASAKAAPPSAVEPFAVQSALHEAKVAADRGHLDRADAIMRDALAQKRTPEALHLLALILGERGQIVEMEALLLEAVEKDPQYALGHLSLGLLERPKPERWRSAHFLRKVIELLSSRRDEETLQGPESLQVAMARRLAMAGLENLETRP